MTRQLQVITCDRTYYSTALEEYLTNHRPNEVWNRKRALPLLSNTPLMSSDLPINPTFFYALPSGFFQSNSQQLPEKVLSYQEMFSLFLANV